MRISRHGSISIQGGFSRAAAPATPPARVATVVDASSPISPSPDELTLAAEREAIRMRLQSRRKSPHAAGVPGAAVPAPRSKLSARRYAAAEAREKLRREINRTRRGNRSAAHKEVEDLSRRSHETTEDLIARTYEMLGGLSDLRGGRAPRAARPVTNRHGSVTIARSRASPSGELRAAAPTRSSSVASPEASGVQKMDSLIAQLDDLEREFRASSNLRVPSESKAQPSAGAGAGASLTEYAANTPAPLARRDASAVDPSPTLVGDGLGAAAAAPPPPHNSPPRLRDDAADAYNVYDGAADVTGDDDDDEWAMLNAMTATLPSPDSSLGGEGAGAAADSDGLAGGGGSSAASPASVQANNSSARPPWEAYKDGRRLNEQRARNAIARLDAHVDSAIAEAVAMAKVRRRTLARSPPPPPPPRARAQRTRSTRPPADVTVRLRWHVEPVLR